VTGLNRLLENHKLYAFADIEINLIKDIEVWVYALLSLYAIVNVTGFTLQQGLV
jgi:hypothetical protein